eukprot:2014115-Prorocentrum_lima.AAC.1
MAKRGAAMQDIPEAILCQYATADRLMDKVGRYLDTVALPVVFGQNPGTAARLPCRWSTPRPGRTER